MSYSQQTWALIKDGVIANTALCDDSAETLFADQGWDQIIDITDIVELGRDDPGIGYTWTEAEGFRPPKPHPSFVWDESEKKWTEPVAKPEDVTEGKHWLWDEDSVSWVEHDLPEEE
jgi:hypothetical protein